MSVRTEASTIVGVRIEPGYWKQSMERLDRQGALNKRHMLDLIIMLCEHVEKLEAMNGSPNPSQTDLQPPQS